ncbi:MAG: GNAT family N-acetyltransferase [Parasphingorhabdus sp.]|nr:GNAT family N-acetyltransferase [Parasphingorhabdus sp.]
MKALYHHLLSEAQASAQSTPGKERPEPLFDRISWFAALHRLCLPRTQPLIAHVRDGSSDLWMFLTKSRSGHADALANWYSFHFRPLFSDAMTEVGKLALLGELARTIPHQAHSLVLSPLPDEDHSTTLIERAFLQAGWVVFRQQSDVNHILQIKGRTFDSYWQERPGALRNTVKRKTKKSRVAIRIEREFVEECWDDYCRVYAKSWKPEEGSPDFLEWLARNEADAGALRLGLAYLDGEPVAAQLWTLDNRTALIHKLAHDEAVLKESAGTLLSAAMFQHVIDIDGVDMIDFGTGDDGYKRDWMETVRPRYRLEMYWPNNPMTWPAIAKRGISVLVARTRSS